MVLAVMAVVSFLLSWSSRPEWIPLPELGELTTFYSAPTRAWEFAAGGLLAVFAVSRFGRLTLPRVGGFVVGAAGVALVTGACLIYDSATPFPGVAALLPVSGSMLLLAAGTLSPSNSVNRLLSLRPLRWLGDISYGWYLWHWPLIVFATRMWPDVEHVGVVAGVLGIALAWLSYRFVEQPIRHTPTPSSRRTLALAAACVLLPLVAVQLHGMGERAMQRTALKSFDTAFAFHADVNRGCDSWVPYNQREQPERCKWPVAGSAGLAVLIGDSNAGHFSEAFTVAANNEGLNAVVATHSACPFVDVIVMDSLIGGVNETCREFVTASMDALVADPPAVVVIASATDLYIEQDRWAVQDPSSSIVETDPDSKSRLWVSGLHRVVSRLEQAGIGVLVVHPVPKLPPWNARECPMLRRIVSEPSCGISIERTDAMQHGSRALAAEKRALEGTETGEIDFFDHLCPTSRCSAFAETGWRWMDSNHISVEANAALVPVFAASIAYQAITRGSP